MLQDVETLRDGPSEGAYVYGLQLEGCAWSSKQNCLIDAEPRKLFCPLPLVLFTAIQVTCSSDVSVQQTCINLISRSDFEAEHSIYFALQGGAETARHQTVFEAPCYASKLRTSDRFLTTIKLRTSQSSSKWILNGAAVLANAD